MLEFKWFQVWYSVIIQLGTVRNLIYSVFEKHDDLPELPEQGRKCLSDGTSQCPPKWRMLAWLAAEQLPPRDTSAPHAQPTVFLSTSIASSSFAAEEEPVGLGLAKTQQGRQADLFTFPEQPS